MSFREQMQVSPSNADIEIRVAVKRSDLGKFLLPIDTVVIFDSTLTLLNEEEVTKAILQRGDRRLRFTKPDLLFLKGSQLLPVYLHGPPHEKPGAMNRDDRIESVWFKYGIEPAKFRYKVPLSQKRKLEILKKIEEALNG